jgi:tRNA dimethylallyltransferase
MEPKLIIVLGPTAAGKSAIALALAEEIGGEIINADSQQVYRSMDIGTGKPSKEERDRVAHHIIDVVDPNEEFNVALFRQLATDSVYDIASRGRKAIVCGGTGLYIRALTKGLFVGPGQEPKIRAALRAEVQEHGLDSLYQRLKRVDPPSTSWIHPHDQQRIVRALEVFELTGKAMSEWQREHRFDERRFETLKIGLDRPREELYALIDRRCERMIEDGLVDEVKHLVAMGYDLKLKSLSSVGYRHVGLFLSGAMPLHDAMTLMKRDTRRLAKRQLTWFRREREVQWRHPERERTRILQLAKEFMHSCLQRGKD